MVTDSKICTIEAVRIISAAPGIWKKNTTINFISFPLYNFNVQSGKTKVHNIMKNTLQHFGSFSIPTGNTEHSGQ
jgi:hypothetical protein